MGVYKALGKAAVEGGQQFLKRMAKAKTLPKLAPQITDTLTRHIDITKGADNLDLETMLKGVTAGDESAIESFNGFTKTLLASDKYQANVAEQTRAVRGYTRPDAMQNLQQAGLNPPKGGGLTGRKNTRRTIQGPVPPQLADKTFDQGAKSYEEAVMLGTTKFEEDGVAKQIRNYGSDTAPHGRVTEVDVRKMSGRGTEARLTYEKLLTLDKKAKGFYSVKIKGHEHAHHWNPIGVMKRVVEGLDDKTRNQLISEAQNEFGLYSGNTMFNLRQLPTKVHDKLHKALNKAGYDPKKMQSFAKADYATRKEYLRAFSKVLNDLDQQVFGEVMIEKHGPNWISQFQGLQVE